MASGATAESTAVALADEFVESSAANKNGGARIATAAVVAIIHVQNFIVVLLNCCSRKSSILTIGLARLACDWLECGNRFALPSYQALLALLARCIAAKPICAETVPRGTVSAWPYGTLITVFTRVTDPIKESNLPLMVVIVVIPAVPVVTPE